MQGPSHIITNVCTAIVCVDALFEIKDLTFGMHLYATVCTHLCPTYDVMINCLWWVAAVCLFLLGTLLPDCDSEHSLIGRKFYVPVEHRTYTHTIYIPFVFFIIAIWCRLFFYLGLGYLLHLFWDSLSVGGVCYFYPISQYRRYGTGAKIKKHHILKLYRTGKTSERIVVWSMIVFTIMFTAFCVVTHIDPNIFTPAH